MGKLIEFRSGLKKKTFLERLYAWWYEAGQGDRYKALGYAYNQERQYFDPKTLYIGPDDGYFQLTRFVLCKHMNERVNYVISEEFAKALDTKSDLKLSSRYLYSRLADEETFAIELPYAMRTDTEHVMEDVYKQTVIFFNKKIGDDSSILFYLLPYYQLKDDMPINYIKKGEDSDPKHLNLLFYAGVSSGSITLMTNKDMEIAEIYKQEKVKKSLTSNRSDYDLIVLALKCLLYVKSDGQPDLRAEKEIRPIVTDNPKKMRRQFMDEPQFPIIKVGFGFAKVPMYDKDQWIQRGHFRWQPFDSRDNPKYKLIWIDEMLKTRRQLSDPEELTTDRRGEIFSDM